VPSYRPATGHIAAGDKFFAWLVAVPEGEIRGTLTADDMTRTVTGSGYHDHNWGNVSPADIFDDWWWGRGFAGGHTVIASVIRAKPRVGGNRIPLFFVGSERATEVNAYGSEVDVSEGRRTRPTRSTNARSTPACPLRRTMVRTCDSTFPSAC
jgi:predicted secreted hydrolase